MGKTKAKTSNALALQLDAQGDVKFDLIAKQGSNKNKIVHSKFTDLLPKQVTEDDPDLVRPDPDTIKEVSERCLRY
jgi:SNW domain-containing protein 1